MAMADNQGNSGQQIIIPAHQDLAYGQQPDYGSQPYGQRFGQPSSQPYGQQPYLQTYSVGQQYGQSNYGQPANQQDYGSNNQQMGQPYFQGGNQQGPIIRQ